MKTIKLFEAFAGIGAQHESLKQLLKEFPGSFELKAVGLSEIDVNAYLCYQAAHGNIKNFGDITRIDWDDVPDFNLFTYSSPCQDWSQCGKQAGGEEGSGTRSSLLWECRRAILAKKPKYAIFENVPAVLSNKFKDTFLKWVAELDTCGYNNFFQVVNAKHQGTAQNRPRLFMVSILRTEDDPNPQYAFPHAKILDKGVIDYLDSIGDVREDHYINEAGMTPENMAMLLEQPEVKVQVLEAYHQKRIKQNDSSAL